ncbi:MAG: hypothetical protein RR415_12925, partial [Ruthenibacterium sp.]
CLVTKGNSLIFTEQQIAQGEACYKYNFTDFAEVLDKFSLSYESEKYKYSDAQPPLSGQPLRVPVGTTINTIIEVTAEQ